MRQRNFFSKDWILSYPKTINESGCWIPIGKKPLADGYVRVKIKNKTFKLHRVVLCIFNNIDYHNLLIETRHLSSCIRSCFNPEHLRPGSHTDNMNDIKESNELKKLRCPRCNTLYTKIVLTRKNSYNNQKVVRYCRVCRNRTRKLNRETN